MGTREYTHGRRAGRGLDRWTRAPQATDRSDPTRHPDPGFHRQGEKGAVRAVQPVGLPWAAQGMGLSWGRTGPSPPTLGGALGWPGESKSGAPGCWCWQPRFLLERQLSGMLMEKPALALGLLVWRFGGVWGTRLDSGHPRIPLHGDGGSHLPLAELSSFLIPGEWLREGGPAAGDELWVLSPGDKGAPASCPPKAGPLGDPDPEHLSAGCTGVDSGEFRPLKTAQDALPERAPRITPQALCGHPHKH